MQRIVSIVLTLLLLAVSLGAAADPVPPAARAYERELTRLSQEEFGLGAPVALFAAQIHQESSWRADASSRYADGLAQFTPATADWIAEIYPDLGSAAPYSPGWAMRAMLRYDQRLHSAASAWQSVGVVPACDRWAMALSGYNGGPGWLSRDRRLTAAAGDDPDRWWGHVEEYSARAAWAMRENRGYPRRILRVLEPRYVDAGFRGQATCGA